MSICGWILLGGLAGWIASLITDRDDRQGCLTNIIVGIVGAAIGGGVVGIFGAGGVTGLNFWSLIVAVLGSVLLLAFVNLLTRR